MAIVLNNVCISYGANEAVTKLNCEFKGGEITTIIGSNGAGKTSILRAITKLSKLSGGKIIIDKVDIEKLSTAGIIKLGISHCPEGRRVFSRMTIKENLYMGAYLEKDKLKKIERFERVLSIFPILKERLQQMAGTFSGGQQQMLAIGRALMAGPKIILLDEPSLGLAPLIVKSIAKIVENIKNEGIGVVLVEQNANMALELASYGYVLENGKLALEGPASELQQNDMVKKAYLGG